MKPVHFANAANFRRWLEANHDKAKEIWVGFYKRDSGRGGITYAEALDEALCFGWIDGIRKSVDAESYVNRFTPRKPGSNWSRINVAYVQRLEAAGRMQPAGRAAFERRTPAKTGVYSFENRPHDFPPDLARLFRRQRAAWAFWERQPPGYRRTAIWWVISAKQDVTRRRRLERLIAISAAGRRLGP